MSYPVLMASSYDEADLVAVLSSITRANTALLSTGTYYLAVSEDGSVVGCGGWTRERPGNGEVATGLAHLRHFGTHPGWTRRGVGRAIYGTCERDARSADVRRFECYSSLNAKVFYAALGFKPIGHISLLIGHELKLPAILMERLI